MHFAECSLLGRGGCKEVAEGALGYLGVIPAAVSDRPGVDLWMRAPVTRLRLRRYVLAHRADAERPLCAGAVLQLLRGVIGPLPRAVVGRPNLVEGTGRERRTSSDAGLDLHVGHLLIQGPALELAVAVLAAVVAGTVKVTGPALACGLTPSCPSRGCTGVGASALALAVILALALPLGQGLDGTREALELLLERPRLLGDHGLHDHVASRVAPAGCMPCHRAGLRAAALVLHLRLHPVDPSGVGVQLRAADERGEHLGRHELLKGRAAHPLWHLQARGADLFAQALPLRQRLPEPGHRGAARRLLVLAGLRVLQLRGTALPLAVQPAPKLRAAAGAGAGAGEEAVGDDVLHRLKQDAVHHLVVVDPQLHRLSVDVLLERGLRLLLGPQQELPHVRAAAAEVPEGTVVPHAVSVRLRDKVQRLVVVPTTVVHAEVAVDGRHRRPLLVRHAVHLRLRRLGGRREARGLGHVAAALRALRCGSGGGGGEASRRHRSVGGPRVAPTERVEGHERRGATSWRRRSVGGPRARRRRAFGRPSHERGARGSRLHHRQAGLEDGDGVACVRLLHLAELGLRGVGQEGELLDLLLVFQVELAVHSNQLHADAVDNSVQRALGLLDGDVQVGVDVRHLPAHLDRRVVERIQPPIDHDHVGVHVLDPLLQHGRVHCGVGAGGSGGRHSD